MRGVFTGLGSGSNNFYGSIVSCVVPFDALSAADVGTGSFSYVVCVTETGPDVASSNMVAVCVGDLAVTVCVTVSVADVGWVVCVVDLTELWDTVAFLIFATGKVPSVRFVRFVGRIVVCLRLWESFPSLWFPWG